MSQKECQSKKTKRLASRKEIYRFSDSNVKTGIIRDGEKNEEYWDTASSLFFSACAVECGARMMDFSHCVENEISTV